MTSNTEQPAPNPATLLAVTHVTVLTGSGSDLLKITLALPSGVWPYRGEAHASMEVVAREGLRYVCTYMRGVPTTLIVTGQESGLAMQGTTFEVDWERNRMGTLVDSRETSPASWLPLPASGPFAPDDNDA